MGDIEPLRLGNANILIFEKFANNMKGLDYGGGTYKVDTALQFLSGAKASIRHMWPEEDIWIGHDSAKGQNGDAAWYTDLLTNSVEPLITSDVMPTQPPVVSCFGSIRTVSIKKKQFLQPPLYLLLSSAHNHHFLYLVRISRPASFFR